jgi:hypothetical protein
LVAVCFCCSNLLCVLSKSLLRAKSSREASSNLRQEDTAGSEAAKDNSGLSGEELVLESADVVVASSCSLASLCSSSWDWSASAGAVSSWLDAESIRMLSAPHNNKASWSDREAAPTGGRRLFSVCASLLARAATSLQEVSFVART